MGDRGAERALRLRALHVHVDPLVVARDLGELVDVLLGDLAPVARADGLPDERLELVDSVHGGGGAHGAEVSQPWWYQGFGVERLAQRALPAPITGSPCVTRTRRSELEQRLQGRVEALAVEALRPWRRPCRRPTPQRARRPPRRHRRRRARRGSAGGAASRSARLADRVRGHAAGQRRAGLDLAEAGGSSGASRCRVAVDGGLGVAPVAPPELLRAAHVVRDRDQDGEPVAELAVERTRAPRPARRGSSGSISRSVVVAGLGGEARHLCAELAGMPLGMARRPAPESVA